MRRVLLDQNVPLGVRTILPGHEVQRAYHLGCASLSNGELLATAERAGFDLMVTGDKNLAHQQNLAKRSIAIVALGTTHWATIRANPQPVQDAVQAAMPGGYAVVTFPRPPLRRRSPVQPPR
jgi:putative NIF3 family GTP cyclohydrolase 1 type 2